MEKVKYMCSECKMYKNANEFFHVAYNKHRAQQKGKCALTGFDMTYKYVCNKYKYSVSLDRIDPEKGYTLDNLQLVCHAANMMKGTFSENELLKFCEAIIKNKNHA